MADLDPSQKQLPLNDGTTPLNTPPAAPPADPPAEPVKPSPLDALKDLGFEDVKDEAEAIERLATAFKQQQKREEQFQQVLEELRASREQTKQPEPAKPGEKADWWNPPQIDQAELARYRTAEGWKPETPIEVRQQGDAYQRYIDQWTNKLVRNPKEALGPVIQAEVNRLLEEKLGAVTAEQREQQAREQLLTQNDWLYEKDPVTKKPAIDFATGQPMLSAEGKLFNQHFMEAEKLGIPTFAAQWKYAEAMHKASKASVTPPEATPNPAQINEDKKAELLRRGLGAQPNRGPDPAAKNLPNRNLSPGQRFAQFAKANGVSVG